MRRGGRGRRYGIPTGESRPESIDDYTGFKVHLDTLKKDWQGLLTQNPDRRNPPDFVRGVKDDQSLPYSRPESADVFVALPLLWQDGVTFITTQSGGNDIYQEGIIAEATL